MLRQQHAEEARRLAAEQAERERREAEEARKQQAKETERLRLEQEEAERKYQQAKEAARKNITVNCIAPGHIMTDMLAAVGEDKLAAAAARIPMRRLGQPEELAAAVTFLCTEDASWVTGQTLIVSGGGTVN